MTRLLLAGTTGLLALLTACSAPQEPAEPADMDATATEAEAAPETTETDADEADAAALPGVDIYIAPLSWVEDIPALGAIHNATQRAGYDNQPAFTADGQSFYYASGDGPLTDIWRCNLDCSERVRITDTPDSGEYSPRPTPAGEALSYIYQAPGGYGGEVWLDRLEGGEPRSASSVGPNGYYAFNADMTRLAVFALDEVFHLKVFDRFSDDEPVDVAEQIGRALYAAPDHASVLFTQSREDGGFSVHETGFDGEGTQHLFDLPGETQDYAVFSLADGRDAFFAVDEGVLMMRTRDLPWSSIADLGEAGLDGVSRMAVSPDRSHIALVAFEPAPH
ncbi:TolB family protein [Maricaulis parjimensis]|uniref:TolB family protein n=1 Tax=Maricaulis parjimensis TaxID=144023 RepID=UPI00193AC68E|nr:hypothetical protein [Maricaulis parjimensis]